MTPLVQRFAAAVFFLAWFQCTFASLVNEVVNELNMLNKHETSNVLLDTTDSDILLTQDSPIIHQTSGWTVKPECTRQTQSREKYCVYTNSHFAGGRGISVITTPDRADGFLHDFPTFLQPDIYQPTGVDEPSFPPFIAKEIESHGIGLIANRTIEAGEWLMSFTPALIMTEKARADLLPSERLRLQKLAVSRLPAQLRQSVDSLYGQGGIEADDIVDDIIDTNAFSVPLAFEDDEDNEGKNDGESEHYSMLFPEIARFNHACRPSADYFFDPETLTQHVVASRKIFASEEITITYIDPLQRRKARIRALRRSWGFRCDCALCQAEPEVIEASDILVDKILELQEEMADRSPYSEASPASAELMISLLKEEQVWTRLHEAYALAAFEYSGVGHIEEAQKYAELALQHGESCRTSSSHGVDMWRDLEVIKVNPMNHSSWLFRLPEAHELPVL